MAKGCLVVGCFILLASTWATLESEKRSTTVEKVCVSSGRHILPISAHSKGFRSQRAGFKES